MRVRTYFATHFDTRRASKCAPSNPAAFSGEISDVVVYVVINVAVNAVTKPCPEFRIGSSLKIFVIAAF